jgi:hypothetical protein
MIQLNIYLNYLFLNFMGEMLKHWKCSSLKLGLKYFYFVFLCVLWYRKDTVIILHKKTNIVWIRHKDD